MTDKQQILRTAYYDPETGFGSSSQLYRQVKQHGITTKDVREFLSKQSINQINKKNKGKQPSFIPTHPMQQFQIDLIYLDNPHLNKSRYGLVAIDAFTKQGDVELMKKKDKDSTVQAMKAIFKRMGKPETIYSDDGSEFVNDKFEKLMAISGIEHIKTQTHATIVERFNRSIKDLLNKYLQSTGSKTITNALPKLLNNYNNRYHRTIRMAPNEVSTKNQDAVLANITSAGTIKPRAEIKEGDRVRVLKKRKAFDKGYQPRWSSTIYTVGERQGRYYIIEGSDPNNELRSDRTYLRAHIQLIRGDVEHNPNKADIKGTLEGRLKERGKLHIDESSKEEKKRVEEEAKEAIKDRIQRLKGRRRRKKTFSGFT